MSLDCYPLGARRIIDLREQPIAIDVAYDENLLITVIDNCCQIVVFDLNKSDDNVIGQFRLGQSIVIDQVIYSKAGDYIAAVGHKNGQVGLYTLLNWRHGEVVIEELDFQQLVTPLDDIDRRDKISSIGACQKTGNLAVCFGELVLIFKLQAAPKSNGVRNSRGVACQPEAKNEQVGPTKSEHDFKHLASLKLSMWASSIALSENYLSIMAIDHVQVIKLEVLALQILSDNLDDSYLAAGVNTSAGSSGDSLHQEARMLAKRQRKVSKGGGLNVNNENMANETVSASGDESSSIVSGPTSNQSTRTNFSSFFTTDIDELSPLEADVVTAATASQPLGQLNYEEYVDHDQEQLKLNLTDGDLSTISMTDNSVLAMIAHQQRQLLVQQQQQEILKRQQEHPAHQQQAAMAANSQDDCIVWNLNTKKLVKLPTLMQNTSTDLASFHICHPLELLGPASESIACRVTVRIYADNLSENQLEPIVLLCKQFDFDRDPVKLVRLHPIYVSANLDEQKRLNRNVAPSANNADNLEKPADSSLVASTDDIKQPQLLKSSEYEQLATVCCFVSTLTTCLIYSLTGKKVTRLQSITHPGLCLDLRADLVNVYMLTPLGLLVCSTSVCDAALRHDWSSSADLNLSFIACNRTRVLATKRFVIMVSSSSASSSTISSQSSTPSSYSSLGQEFEALPMASFVEILRKPTLGELHERINETVQCCQSVSVRSNLLTYLQTVAQLEGIDLSQHHDRASDRGEKSPPQADEGTILTLKEISLVLAKQLLQKKGKNMITNGKIDKTIKHLFDNSYCDLAELMQRHLEVRRESAEAVPDKEAPIDEMEDEGDAEETADEDFELLKIYLRHTKFNPSILEYLKSLIVSVDDGADSRGSAFELVVAYMAEHNPRLLIKCAQRITRDLTAEQLARGTSHLEYLVEQLKDLVKLNSTGINRATVLFTLAILYQEMASAVVAGGGNADKQEGAAEECSDRQQKLHEQCLMALGQIKPLNHLAITMCSNSEIISRPMAKLVNEHYPQVFKLFLNQLLKRDKQLASRETFLLAQS